MQDKNHPLDHHKELEQKIVGLEKERDEYLNGWKRAKADLVNLKNRLGVEQEEFVKFSKRDWLISLLPIVDNFGRAQKEIPVDHAGDAWVVGVGFIKKQLDKLLQDNGVTEIDASGKKFDPAMHQSLGSVALPDQEEGIVVEVVDPGYMMEGRVLRPAKVKISSK